MKKNVTLALGLPAPDIDAIVKENLRNHFRNNLEFIQYPSITPSNLSHYVSIRGREILDRELAKNRGIVLLTGHFGAKQMLQVALGHSGYTVNQLIYHMSQGELTHIQKKVSQKHRKRIEEKIPTNFIQADGFPRKLYRCLKKREILIIAGDGNGIKERMGSSYHPFPYLGQRMLFPTAPISLAMRTGASVVPAFVVRDKYHQQIIIEEPINLNIDYSEAVQAYAQILEKYVTEFPHLWEFWEEFRPGFLLTDD